MNIVRNRNQKYDVIIIGAGVAGLICANYLAKSGLNILLIEKERKAGGYCTSFERKGFIFDSCVHSLGSCRENGVMGTILKDLDIDQDSIFIKCDPSDLVIINESEYFIYRNHMRTLADFQAKFPKEKNSLRMFFTLIDEQNYKVLYAKIKKYTLFSTLLNDVFRDYRLKAIMNIFLGNIGLPSNKISALTAITLFREHVFDGGYYPKEGMQNFTDILVANFVKNGGEILLKQKVEKIAVKNNEIKGVFLENAFLKTKYIVAACDINQVLFNLIGKEKIDKRMARAIKKRLPSISGFTVYVGLSSHINTYFRQTKANIWYCPNYNINEEYRKLFCNGNYRNGGFIFCSSPSLKNKSLAPKNKSSLELMILAPYISKDYWLKNTEKVEENIIKRVSKFFPEFEKKIEVIESSTPITLEKYTANYRGALYGWASIPTQVSTTIEMSCIKNLLFAGHWIGSSSGYGGIPNAAYSGKIAASKVIRSIRGKV